MKKFCNLSSFPQHVDVACVLFDLPVFCQWSGDVLCRILLIVSASGTVAFLDMGYVCSLFIR